MTKETIPQSIIDKINKEYPLGSGRYSTSFRGFNKLQEAKRQGAEFGYGLSEERIKELEASDKWISVKDGLPEKPGRYYCIDPNSYPERNEVCILHFGSNEQWSDDAGNGCHPTHYQYLPKPPKDI